MLTHRRWNSLDGKDFGWLRARYHFAVSADGNPQHAPIGPLIVWNDDEIAAGRGFPMHGHRDVEIVSYVRQGTLVHRDTLGSEGVIQAGDVQVMSAGTGIRHSETNVGDVPLKVYQIWLLPRQTGGAPAWDTRPFPRSDRSGRFVVLASGFAGDEEALPIRADARVLGAMLKTGERIRHVRDASSSAYLVVASGRIEIDGEIVGPLDGVAITQTTAIEIVALEESELVMVDAG
ncbi:pirin family protein [Burkholderia pseudomultivorans]|uniref:Cupin domain protein n=1 Tax=Burkholderia cenocepacia TaxID=95486 RepID=A0AAN0VKV5_9BURK|nr:pirin family protein [Burkholderia pseudomultivorans]AIO31040.1 cupin domain protein [Burkholderia cenocepacia]KWE99414.1 pirin [Burkholderia pseudomultivorans]